MSARSHTTTPYQAIVNSADREAWLKARLALGTIGSSESATIMGANPYESAFTLYCRRQGLLPDKEETRYMRWGLRLEAAIADGFQEETGIRTWTADSPEEGCGGWLCRSNKWPWLSATPDRSMEVPDAEEGILEVKNAAERFQDSWNEEAPLHYRIQAQHQFAVTDLSAGAICVLLGGNDLRWQRTKRNERFIRALVSATKDFHERLEFSDPPEPDTHPSTSSTLTQLTESGVEIELPDLVLEWHIAAAKASEDRKAAEERYEEYRRKIAAVMGTASVGKLPNGGHYTFRKEPRSGYTVPPKEVRVLRYHKPGKKK